MEQVSRSVTATHTIYTFRANEITLTALFYSGVPEGSRRSFAARHIEGLAAYALMAQGVGKPEIAKEYSKLAVDMATTWQTVWLW